MRLGPWAGRGSAVLIYSTNYPEASFDCTNFADVFEDTNLVSTGGLRKSRFTASKPARDLKRGFGHHIASAQVFPEAICVGREAPPLKDQGCRRVS